MKKLTLIVSAIALLIGFSQCKKEVITPNTTDQGIHITLNAGYGQNGQKTDFDAGSFVWTNGATEYVYVGGANHSGCIGVLSGTGNGTATMTFTGDLTDTPAEGETLHFFYLGKGRDGSAVNTLDFSNQNGTDVTNCHIAIGSVEVEYTGQTSFTATLNMAMAIAYFDLSRFGSGNIYLNGEDVYSTATINYTSGSISGNSKGFINVGTAGSKYVALIPSVETETTLNFNSSSKTGSMTFNNGIQPAKYYSNNGAVLSVNATEGSGIPGTFSVSATKKVFFSKGNLQYQASTNTWRFAENQYDYIGSAAGNITNADDRATQSNWIDIFSWATSGYDNTAIDEYAIRFQPYLATISTEVNSTYNQYGYGPSTYMTDKNLVGTSAKYDWGVYNTISNGGTGWRTLTQGNGEGEWFYLLGLAGTPNPGTNCRSVNNTLSVQARYTMATIGGTYKGLIIFPDVYVHPDGTDFVAGTFNAKSDYTATVSVDGWKKMEAAGAVFLPAAGYRTYNVSITYPNEQGRYWSVNYYDKSQARYVYFASSTFGASYINRCYGCSVRLVRNVE